MPGNYVNDILQWINPKKENRNLISAAFHMMVITLISMSMVQLDWFSISGDACTPYITLSQFFWFGYTIEDVDDPDYECITNTITNLMRIIILLCFMAIIFSLTGFFLDIIGPKSSVYNFLRKWSLLNYCTTLFLMAVMSIGYYISGLLEDVLRLYKADASVSYGYGFYLIAITCGIPLIGALCNILLVYGSASFSSDDRCLIENMEDSMSTFHNPPPPPPYNIPPPLYTP